MNKSKFNTFKNVFLKKNKEIKQNISTLDTKGKNNLILVISACLIVFAIIIAGTSSAVSKHKAEKPSETETTSPITSTTTKPQTTEPLVLFGSNGGTYKIATQNDPLTMRLSPISGSDAVTTIPKGATVEVLGIYNDFGFVIYDGTSGWISMSYTELITPSTKITTNKPGKYTVNSSDGELSVRNRPDGSLGTPIPNGTELEIISVCEGLDCEWGLMEYDGEIGWLPFRYLK